MTPPSSPRTAPQLNAFDPSTFLISAYGDSPLSSKLPDLAKATVIILAFGGGLIPALLSVNKSIAGILIGDRTREDVEKMNEIISSGNKVDTLEDVSLIRGQVYVDEPEVSDGDDIVCKPLAAIRRSNVESILSALNTIDDFVDWSNLPSTKVKNLEVPTNPPMWLPRATFKASVRGRIKGGAAIPDKPLDVVFDR